MKILTSSDAVSRWKAEMECNDTATTTTENWLRILEVQRKDDIDSLFDEFKDDPEYKEGLVEAGSVLADSIYGEAVTLKSMRLRKGLTQSDLAMVIGIKQSALARLENDENQDPLLSTLEKLSNALGVSIDLVASAFRNKVS